MPKKTEENKEVDVIYTIKLTQGGANIVKILIASDSFKGSLSTVEVAEQIKKGILQVFPDTEFQIMPIADGGEGTVEALISNLGGRYESVQVHTPNGELTQAIYGILDNGTAVLEMAQASGLTLVPAEERDILTATTYGTGELIKAALDRGCRRICIGIGGSATNDAGVGMAQALGVSFRDREGQEIPWGGGSLKEIASIDMTGIDKRLKETEIIVMCDVTNPLYGPDGAASIYGPQKGATEELIAYLDQGMIHLADMVQAQTSTDIRWEKGAGAAGGLGWGLVVFAGATLKRGIEAILDICNFDERAAWADLIVTGEGQIDNQSVCGKVIDGISQRAAVHGKPVIAIAGSVADNADGVYRVGVQSMEACVCRPMKVKQALDNAKGYLEKAAERMFRSIRLGMDLAGGNGGRNES